MSTGSSEILVKRTANAFVADAESTLPLDTVRLQQIDGVLQAFKSAHGGLWVGGQATLSASTLAFHANAVNRAAQSGTLDIEIPLSEIAAVEVRPALLTRIVAVRTARSVLQLRCFRAADFAAQISRLTGAVPPAA